MDADTTADEDDDGTKANPYTVAELNAQKDVLAASNAVVWVKADLKGLGEDGTSTDNADTTGEDGKTYTVVEISASLLPAAFPLMWKMSQLHCSGIYFAYL